MDKINHDSLDEMLRSVENSILAGKCNSIIRSITDIKAYGVGDEDADYD